MAWIKKGDGNPVRARVSPDRLRAHAPLSPGWPGVPTLAGGGTGSRAGGGPVR